MNGWQYLKRLVGFKPGLFMANVIVAIIFSLLEMVPGLTIRNLLNGLTDETLTNRGLWWFIALILASTIARVIFLLVRIALGSWFRFSGRQVCRREYCNSFPGRAVRWANISYPTLEQIS